MSAAVSVRLDSRSSSLPSRSAIQARGGGVKAWSFAPSIPATSEVRVFTCSSAWASASARAGCGTPRRDELDEVVDARLGAVQLDPLQPEILRHVLEVLADLHRYALVDELEDVGLENLLVQRADELILETLARDEHPVVRTSVASH